MTIVWTNGCFDVLHRGHIEMLSYAKSLGDVLYVGIDSDKKVNKDKGSSRPFNNEQDRLYMLKSLKAVDEVVIFSSPEELTEEIKKISPDFLVVGSDWEGKQVVGAEHSKQVCFFERIDGYSTTQILEKNENLC